LVLHPQKHTIDLELPCRSSFNSLDYKYMRPLVLCGSQRFKNEFESFVAFLRKKGVFVLTPNFRGHSQKMISKKEEERLKTPTYRNKVPGLVLAHFAQISQVHSMGGVCMIFNPLPGGKQGQEHGYIGSNTQAEIGYACAKQMPIILLKPHEEEWIMSVAHSGNDKNRVFTMAHPKASPADWHSVYKWLQKWLN